MKTDFVCLLFLLLQVVLSQKCNYAGVAGTCMDFHSCNGTSRQGVCPGPNNIQCCLPKVWASCKWNGQVGQCVDYHYCTGASTTENLCPGGNEIRCCIPSAPHVIDVPLACQLPELKNGCEVTSLSMLLGWKGIKVNKMTLAAQVAKDKTPYSVKDGIIHWGDPMVGFVGDITGRTMGFSVYHGPVLNLARKYHAATDLTGQSFEQILQRVASGKPVWVITTFSFAHVPDSQWKTIVAPTRTYRMTFNEHSVVITGYDANSLYINDPYACQKNRRVDLKAFRDGWQQFGNQAIILE